MSDEMMTYDAAGGYVLLFGGVNDSSGATYNQTWTYHSGKWTQLHPKHSPPARYDGMMAYNPKTKDVVLFGGDGSGGAFYNDTWIFSGGQWTDVTYATGMFPLSSGSMAYDPQSGHVLEFGGYQDPCGCVDWPSNALYAFEKSNWTQLHTKGVNYSLQGQSASVAYDSKDGYLLEFGGYDPYATGPFTWNYTHGRWTELKVSQSPSWRFSPNLVYDPKLGGVIMFGGVNATGPAGPSDTWKFAGGSWVKLTPSASPPGEIAPSAATYDTADGYLVLFGGQSSSSGPSNNTWVFK